MTRALLLTGAVAITLFASAASATPARASTTAVIKKVLCKVAGRVDEEVGATCTAASTLGGVLSTVGHALGSLFGGAGGTIAKKAGAVVVFAAVSTWAAKGAGAALAEAARVIGRTTAPQLTSTWFSSAYWRVAGLSALLALPFLFAAAIQALVRSEPLLLARAAFGYLPAALLLVSITAPLTMLLLAASDEMSAIVSAAAGDNGGRFLVKFGEIVSGLHAAGFGGSSFLVLFGGIVIVIGGMALSLELLLREAAVYVVVLMLPLAFAAMVWPARRTWAIRAVEMLVALILAKFVVVAVLALAAGALGQLGDDGVGTVFAGMALLILATFSPWVLLRLLPLAEVAAGAGSALRGEVPRLHAGAAQSRTSADGGPNLVAAIGSGEWAANALSWMHRGATGEFPVGAGSTAPAPDGPRYGGPDSGGGPRGAGTGGDPGHAPGGGDPGASGGRPGGGSGSSGPDGAGGGSWDADDVAFGRADASASGSAGGSPPPPHPAAERPPWAVGMPGYTGGERQPGMDAGWQDDEERGWRPLELGPPSRPISEQWKPEPDRDERRPDEQPPQDGRL